MFHPKIYLKNLIENCKKFFPLKKNKTNKYKLNEKQLYPKGRFFIESLEKNIIEIFKDTNFQLEKKIVCIGTCFAEEFAFFLKKNSKNYEVYESNKFNFQANWGRVYTTRNLRQIIQYSFDDNFKIFTKKSLEGFLDPLRDYSCGFFDDQEKLITNIKNHRNLSKKILKECDYLFLTLGQTESWFDKKDKFLWGSAPVKMQNFYEDRKDFDLVDFSLNEIIQDLYYVVENLIKNNTKLNIFLTLSPVPSFATFFNKNVILSSSYGKSKLRVAIEEIVSNFSKVKYFPSFENVMLDNSNFRVDNRHVKIKKTQDIFKIFKKNKY
tara:strand:+ start:285 stop:1253 length:969 start_codon:yes stop_codon:yes gene_type:complete